MKKMYVILFLTALTFQRCNSTILQDSKYNNIKGNGKIVEKIIETTADITNIENTGIFNIVVSQAEKQEIKVVTDENILPYLEYKTSGDKIIFSKKGKENLEPTKAIIYISIKNLVSTDNTGTGNMELNNLTSSNDLNIDNSGTGNITFNNFSNNKELKIINSGTGDVKANNVTISKIDIKNTGTGNMSFNGKTPWLIILNSGTGNINTTELQAENVEIDNSGTGNVKAFAIKEISIEASGTGDVEYEGQPQIKKINATGVAKVKKVN